MDFGPRLEEHFIDWTFFNSNSGPWFKRSAPDSLDPDNTNTPSGRNGETKGEERGTCSISYDGHNIMAD